LLDRTVFAHGDAGAYNAALQNLTQGQMSHDSMSSLWISVGFIVTMASSSLVGKMHGSFGLQRAQTSG
jgi:hypothetical protein